MNRVTKEKIFTQSLFLSTALCFLILVVLLSIIFINGISAINIEFLFTESKNFGAEGGIFYQILGSLLILGITALLSFPIAIGTALCSSEYVANKKIRSITTTLIYGLNGVPSIIFGHFFRKLSQNRHLMVYRGSSARMYDFAYHISVCSLLHEPYSKYLS